MIKLKNYWLFSVPVNFEISWGKILFSRHLIVKLNHKNHFGVGEGVLYKTNGQTSQKFILKIVRAIEKETSVNKAQKKIQKFVNKAPGVVCAFDIALWDLKAKLKNKNLSQVLGKVLRKKIKITEQIFIKDEKKTLLELKETVKNQTHLKLKIGQNFSQTIFLLKQIRKQHPRLNLQVDANQSLKPNDLKKWDAIFKKLKISALEEPVKKNHWQKLSLLKTPVILDESVCSLANLKKARQNRAISILNVKLSRLGGITNSLKFTKFCQKNHLKATVGCSEELGIGTAAILHLSAVANIFSTEGLGPKRLGFDIINEKYKFQKGFVEVPQKKGLGVTFNPNLLKKHSKIKKFPVLEKNQKTLWFSLNEAKNIIYSKIINLLFFIKSRRLGLK